MIYSLHGTLIYTDLNTAVVECGGVGYRCRATQNTLAQLPKNGEECFLYTYLSVREDAVELYGFADPRELDCFKQLISVNGVGPKAGLSILSSYTPDQLALLISTADFKSITKANGVGPKMAQRIVLELKDKMGLDYIGPVDGTASAGEAADSNIQDAVQALIAIGYSQSEAVSAVRKLDPALPADTLIKQALQVLG